MSNPRTFLWLFVYVQTGFITLDLYEHWRLARQTGVRHVVSRYRVLILAVAAACLLYFAIQIALASFLPAIGKLSDDVIRAARIDMSQAETRWVVPVFVGAFFTGTFFDYLVHRFLLHGFLWRLHENHHLPSVVSNVMPGIAARPFVVVPNFLINAGSCVAIFGVVRLIGRPQLIATFIHVVPALLLTFAFVASASHSIFLRRFDWAETAFRGLFLISPREHLLHHAARIQGNYGNFTALWDHAFGTYIAPTTAEFPLGLDYDQDFLGAITAGRCRLSPGTRSRFQIARVCHLEESALPEPE
ncbi:MAG TPA: sterol desaturase family protein [Candidatus Sulfotelmatobacter sp.]|jgi:sterol desaturase/sphingolipid hydroxylase (fatty acid hydroxylase superfamily)|nr:sterol desaturase family protein [Candidatus Sulfotelmatobacter sp.]